MSKATPRKPETGWVKIRFYEVTARVLMGGPLNISDAIGDALFAVLKDPEDCVKVLAEAITRVNGYYGPQDPSTKAMVDAATEYVHGKDPPEN